MKSKILYLTAFVAGAFIGSAVTYKVVKDKYEKIIEKEIASVKQAFSKTEDNDDTQVEVAHPHSYSPNYVTEKPVDEKEVHEIPDQYANAYSFIASRYGGTKYSDLTESKSIDRPYVIPPEEFGELDNYETISLTYYADDYLTDDMNDLVDDIDEIIGYESLEHFGEYEDDSVFVRNDSKKCDYEILRVEKNYRDIVDQEI